MLAGTGGCDAGLHTLSIIKIVCMRFEFRNSSPMIFVYCIYLIAKVVQNHLCLQLVEDI